MKGTTLAGGSGTPPTIAFIDDRPGHDCGCATGPSKIENQLVWRPQQRFETGLLRTTALHLDNGWWRAIRENTYADRRPGRLAAAQ